ncbi:head decoration protein [Burkholderia multivorans]|uniref:head decoration protein n=1 Tax=Burkholderia multivorans TaxID=87883 RepID=UPI00069D8DD4|nr:head decoration protein [Burkholderia multivorans]MDN7871273.1 head decoration protein [Burkholderia multivorans]MDN7998054.1 head decoration protein [Burkholderia multivorans]
MTLNVNTIGDNPQQPGIYAETYIPDQLIAGNLKIVSQPIILAAGKLPRGSVLGMVSTLNVIAEAAASNVGNGTIGAISATTGSKQGAYQLTATGANTFTVTDPEGDALPNATVGTAYSQSGIAFTITAGATAFAAGDKFTLTVEDAIGTYKLSVKTASDGSQTPVAILADDADASAGPVTAGAYLMAEVNANALNFDPSWDIPSLTAALRSSAIFVKSSVSAADPS